MDDRRDRAPPVFRDGLQAGKAGGGVDRLPGKVLQQPPGQRPVSKTFRPDQPCPAGPGEEFAVNRHAGLPLASLPLRQGQGRDYAANLK